MPDPPTDHRVTMRHRSPPAAERRPTILRAHGDERHDDWWWLRDRDDPAVLAHLRAENDYTEAALTPLTALRAQIYQEMLARIVETDLSVPVRRGSWWYYRRTEEGRSYPIHCRCPAAGSEDPPLGTGPLPGEQVLLDENVLAAGHGYLATANLAVSPDHRRLAYAVDTSGDERYELGFTSLTGPQGEGPDVIPAETVSDTYYGLAWANDNSTVFYTRVDETMRPYQMWRHALGTDPGDDVLVLEEPDERFVLVVGRTKDRAFVVAALHSTTSSEVWVVPGDAPGTPARRIEPRRPHVEYSIDHWSDPHGTTGWFVVLTNDGAEDFRLMAVEDEDPRHERWREVLGHRPGIRVEDVDVFDRWLVIAERNEGEARLRVAPLAGGGGATAGARPDPFGDDLLARSWLVPTDEHPATTWKGPNPRPEAPTVRFEQTSLVSPRAVLDLQVRSRTSVLRKRQPVLGGYDPSDYRTFRMWSVAPDGTRVPVSVVHRNDLLDDPGAPPGTPPAAPAPCLLYGYGAYEHSVDPAFSSLRVSLLDRGVIFAIAHVRGGGELGRRWYEEGKLAHKAATFGDFVASARGLVDRGWTSADRLVARGGSAGGLLIGAVANLAPELFTAMVAEVPFVDCLTTMLDDSLPLTVGEWEEWGNPAANPDAYATIKSYSPYDNVRSHDDDGRPVRYPRLLVTGGLEDSRVGFWEPAKWVAKLRAANEDNQVLLRTELGAGHGGPSGRYDTWREEALVYAFVLDALGLDGDRSASGEPLADPAPGRAITE